MATVGVVAAACTGSGGSTVAPGEVRTALEPKLMAMGYTVPEAFTRDLRPGTVISVKDDQVICQSGEVIAPERIMQAPPDDARLVDMDSGAAGFKFGTTLIAHVHTKTGSTNVQAVDVDLSQTGLQYVADDVVAPRDAACSAKVAAAQDQGQIVMVISEVVVSDVNYNIMTGGSAEAAEVDALSNLLGAEVSGGGSSLSGSSSALVLGYKGKEMAPPGACDVQAPCKTARRVDGTCRCVACEYTAVQWADAKKHEQWGPRGSVQFNKDSGFDLECPNMPDGAIDVRAQGMVTTGIVEKKTGKWSGCVELFDRQGVAAVAEACTEQPAVDREGYVNLAPKEGVTVKREVSSGKVHVEVRNKGTSLGKTKDGPVNLRNFSILVRSPQHAR